MFKPHAGILLKWPFKNGSPSTHLEYSTSDNDSVSLGRSLSHYVPHDLSAALSAYHDLLSAIKDRRLSSTIGEAGLVSVEVLNRFKINGFLRSFLLQAHRPSFSFIAPGISLPNSDWLDDLLTCDRGSARYRLVREMGLVPESEDNENEEEENFEGSFLVPP
jgi:hypothetical protein